ncbi:hypothetical protein [Sphingomonas xinjiangensis]|uniref:Uncharacterized protein n=1 Tax=Sphingomonas xinjiangensis TaxID=643568 RepID=A0A840YN93_9SPHN|nr:hypothetical protein [Sphingomonas xinjiangensis]MBB5711626.1 hypothetical protein [Sphingomonas xinjiangensis]
MVNRSIVLTALGCFFAGAVFAVLLFRSGSPSALTGDLDSEWRKASVQFDTRLRERFPPGTPIASLARELQEQGFAPTWYEVGGEYGAVRQEGNFPCSVAARVYWQPGPNSTLASIRGVYREEGCL